MSKKHIILPTVRTLDEWTKEIDGIEFLYQIKMTSGGNLPTWYPVTFRKKDRPNYSSGGKFEERPNREQVEEHFADSVKTHI